MQLIFSEFQDQLVRGLSHRMNNILSLFHGYLGLLMDDRKLTPVLSEGLARILDGAREASSLMERITAMSRPASSNPRELEPAAFFRQLEPSFERLRTPKVSIAVECPKNLPTLWVDSSRLKLAVLELVRNACEAATARVTIRVGASETAVQPELFPTHSEPQTGEWVKIQVIDDGPGVPAAQVPRIFEPFYSTKKLKSATGLGLGVALGCAQEFGGTVEFCGRKAGTIFEMSLPARAPRQLRAVA